MNSSELLELRCPQNWDLSDCKDIEQRMNDRPACDEDWLPDDTKYASQIGRFKTACLSSYEKYRKGEYPEALKLLDNTDDITDDFMKKYDRVFKHVSMASRAHVLFKLESFNLVKEIVDMIKKEKYTKLEEACFKYVEGWLIWAYYSNTGYERSLTLIKAALKVVPDEAEFNFCLGKFLGRIRHFSFPNPRPTNEEQEALRKAVTLRKDNPKYAIQLSRFYMDYRYYLPPRDRHAYVHQAKATYMNLLKYHKSLSGNDIARCVFYLTKLKCYSDVEEYARMAKNKCNSVMMNHYVGTFFLHIKEYEEALDCLEKASETLPFLAGQVLLVVYRLNDNFIEDEDIEERVANWTQLYESSDKRFVEFLMSISQFYFLVQEDLKNAAVYFNKALERGITEIFIFNLSSVGGCSNYYYSLKEELAFTKLTDADVLKAKSDISTLPGKIVKRDKYQITSVNDLKANLF